MITRDQLKTDLDGVAESHFEVLHRIITALKPAVAQGAPVPDGPEENPLKGSVTFENDILSPINELWSAER